LGGERTQYGGMDYYSVFLMYALFPPVLLTVTWLTYLVVLRLLIRKKRRLSEELTARERSRFQSHFVKTVLVLLFLAYPSLSAKMLSVLNCKELHGSWYLQDDLSIACYTPTHTFYQLLGVVGVLLFPIGIPLAFLGESSSPVPCGKERARGPLSGSGC